MKTKLTTLFILLMLSVQAKAGWFDNDIESQNSREFILNDNGGFENGESAWTASGSSVFAIVTSGANHSGMGAATGSWDASAAGEFWTNDAKFVPNKFGGPKVCDIFFTYKGADAFVDVQVFDVTNSKVVASRTLTTTTEFSEHSFSFTCSPGVSYSFRLASTGNAAIVYLDAVFFGRTIRTMFATPKILTTVKKSVGTVGAIENAQGPLVASDLTGDFAFWPFSGDSLDGSGQLDCGGSACNFTETGTPLYNGKGLFQLENIFVHDGIDDKFVQTNSFLLPGNTDFTVGTWFRTSSWSGGAACRIFAQASSFGARDWELIYSGSGTVSVNSAGGASIGLEATVASFTDNTLHHLVMSHSTGGNFKIYIDGQLAGSVSGATVPTNTATHFVMGKTSNADGGFCGAGDSWENVFFGSSVLTDAQINAIYSKRFIGQQVAGGHQLRVEDSFPVNDPTNKIYIWNLNDANDSSGNNKNLTNNGGIVFTELDIFGQPSIAGLNGTSQFLSSTDEVFNSGDTAFTVGGWFKDKNWNTITLMSQGSTSSLANWMWALSANASGIFSITSTVSATSTVKLSVPNPGFINGSWHHVMVKHDDNKWFVYFDGVLAGSNGDGGGLDISAAPELTLGAIFGTGTSQYMEGGIQDVSYSTFGLSTQDIAKLAASRFDHNKNIQPFDQQWESSFFAEDGHTLNDFDKNWIIDKRQNSLFVDYGLSNPGSQYQLVLKNRGLNGDTIFGDDPFDTGYFSTPPSVPVFYSHGLAAEPLVFWLQHEGHITPGFATTLPASNFCEWSQAQIKCNLSSLTIDATHRVRIIAASSLAGLALLGDPTFVNGIQTQDLMTEDTIVPVGQTMYFGNISIPVGVTLTVNGTLFANKISGAGSITGTGVVKSMGLGNSATEDLIAKDVHIAGDLFVTGTIFGGSPVKISGGAQIVGGLTVDAVDVLLKTYPFVDQGVTGNCTELGSNLIWCSGTASNSTIIAEVVPYQVKYGSGWRMRFNISTSLNVSQDQHTWSVEGIEASQFQAISVVCSNSSFLTTSLVAGIGYVQGGSNIFRTSCNGTSRQFKGFSGDIELTGPPVWLQ